jgi:hypothetical protein
VEYGITIPEIAWEIQDKVKTMVETMTALKWPRWTFMCRRSNSRTVKWKKLSKREVPCMKRKEARELCMQLVYEMIIKNEFSLAGYQLYLENNPEEHPQDPYIHQVLNSGH